MRSRFLCLTNSLSNLLTISLCEFCAIKVSSTIMYEQQPTKY